MTKFLSVVTAGADVGPQDPSTSTPDRAPASVRRTSSIDVTRPEGPTGPIVLDGRARDAVTIPRESGTRESGPRESGPREPGTRESGPVSTTVLLRATLDPFQELVSISAQPPEPLLAGLVGCRVATGFRASAAAAVPEHRRDASLLYLLLDDLPVAALVSGYALQRAGAIAEAPRTAYAPSVDLCSGWAADATIIRVIDEHGTPPMTLGPPAPVLERSDDAAGWHDLPDAAPRTVRRRRRIDVAMGDALVVDAMFRDSHFDDDATESAVHEYGLRARIDPVTFVITEIRATPHVLPYVECPTAAASASRLVGFPLDVVRDRVRAELVGTTTCTHLNDLLRSLEDVRGMCTAYRRATEPDR